ncbi:MAG: hypothetical protein WCO09_02295 [bacterium]
MTSKQNEDRGYIVWSVIMGGLLSFIISIIANLYYGLFVVGNLEWSSVSHQQVLILMLVLVAIIGYLLFFISDYPNTFEFSKEYWRRYRNYFFHRFWPGKILRWVIGFYLIIFFISFLFLIYYFISQSLGYFNGAIFTVCLFILAYIKEKLNKKNV